MSTFISKQLVKKLSSFYPDIDVKSKEAVENAILKIINLLPDKFAEKLRWVRTRLGLNQKGMASALDVSFPAYSSWENGGYVPRIDKIRALNEKLGIDIGDLIPDNPYAINKEIKIPVFNRDFFFGVPCLGLENRISSAIPDTYITLSENERYDFAIKIPSTELFGTQGKVTPSSAIALCNFREMKNMTDEERMYFVSGKLALISITFKDPEIRECFFNGQFLNLKSYDSRKITHNFPTSKELIKKMENPSSAFFLGKETCTCSVGILAIIKRILIDY